MGSLLRTRKVYTEPEYKGVPLEWETLVSETMIGQLRGNLFEGCSSVVREK